MINKIFNTSHISKPFLKKERPSCLVNTIFAQSIDIFRGGRLPLRQSLIAQRTCPYLSQSLTDLTRPRRTSPDLATFS